MKVIVAGFPKTGTKSMHVALQKLGYSVYDVPENFYMLTSEYGKIFREGWTTEDFRRMYEDVDAVVDVPACYFWEEIHKAFPDAKIILTIRKDEDTWFKSMAKQVEVNESNVIFRLLEVLSPTQKRMMREVGWPQGGAIFGMSQNQSIFRLKWRLNSSMFKLKYRAHNAYVMHTAPKDKLLVYECREGWGPLCNFLGLPVPDEPFPHKNVRGNVLEEMLKENPVFKRMQKEVMFSVGAIFFTSLAGGYALYKLGPASIWERVSGVVNYLCRKP